MAEYDVIIVGAGMAGSSIAAELAAYRKVLILEAESFPGYHATGRSAAFWSECYGGPGVLALTTASYPLLSAPPVEFSDCPFLSPRGALHISMQSADHLAARMLDSFAGSDANISLLDAAGIKQRVPRLNPQWNEGVWEPDCCDIDVAMLHGAYLRQAQRAGARLLCDAGVKSAVHKSGQWHIETKTETHTGHLLVNAAGAWADNLANLAGIEGLNIQPYRRTIVHIEVEPVADPAMPLVIGLDESFYFKANSDGSIWLSPHDETPSKACDAAAEEIDIAMAIERFQHVTGWNVSAVRNKWAGLRSFASDRLPVIGYDDRCPAFFWLVGQGGFGIQTAPAVAKLAASLVLGTSHDLPDVDARRYSPARFRSEKST
jgi:D-arginine dehydrogenase